MASREDLAWAAGFWEGEGSIACCQAGGKLKILLSVSQVGSETLERFKSVFGYGAVYGPYVFASRPNRKPISRYAVYGFEKVQATVAMMWPWLSSRRKEQAGHAIKTYIKAFKNKTTHRHS